MLGEPGTKQWYAVSVKSRHEKKVSARFEVRGISNWLPLLERRSKWSDRSVTVAEPLFPGYVFASLEHSEYDVVNRTRGVARLVGFNGTPAPIPSSQIEAIRHALESKLRCDPYPLLKAGKEILIKRGPLKGHYGILLEKTGNCRVLLSIPLIGRSVVVELSSGDVVPL